MHLKTLNSKIKNTFFHLLKFKQRKYKSYFNIHIRVYSSLFLYALLLLLNNLRSFRILIFFFFKLFKG